MTPRLCVVGSCNVDLIVRTPRMPRVGETLAGSGFLTCHGGKGANQAVMAARLGASVAMVGRVGNDLHGQQIKQNFASHSVANLECHQFKYAQFRRPGDVHVHFFGTATLSFSDGFRTESGDEFEIEASPFTLPLRNRLIRASAEPVAVRVL